jgi:hypothetical protein
MAALTDKFTDTRNGARPNSAKVNSPRSAGGVTLVCDNLVGWPTASKVHFVTYKIDSSSVVMAGTQLDCYGIVSGNSIGSFTVVDGTDVGHAVNDVVEILPTAAWGQDLADALTSQHTRIGGHKSITTDTLATTGNVTVAGTLGGAGYSMVTMANPYKFSAYRNGAWSAATEDKKVPFDTELYDTSSNFDSTTNFRFTATVAGFYHFSSSVSIGTQNGSISLLSLKKNGTEAKRGLTFISPGSNNWTFGVSGDIQLAVNDYVEVFLNNTGSASTGQTGAALTFFDGHMISGT